MVQMNGFQTELRKLLIFLKSTYEHIFQRVHCFCLEMGPFTLPLELIWNTFSSESTIFYLEMGPFTLSLELIWNTFFSESTIFHMSYTNDSS